jgi:hypothetical protein
MRGPSPQAGDGSSARRAAVYGPRPPRLQAATLIIAMEVAAFQTALLTAHRPEVKVRCGSAALNRIVG